MQSSANEFRILESIKSLPKRTPPEDCYGSAAWDRYEQRTAQDQQRMADFKNLITSIGEHVLLENISK